MDGPAYQLTAGDTTVLFVDTLADPPALAIQCEKQSHCSLPVHVATKGACQSVAPFD